MSCDPKDKVCKRCKGSGIEPVKEISIISIEITKDRFFDKIRLASEGLITNCWFWRANKGYNGYGMFTNKIFGTPIAHRISYQIFKGKIPEGYEIHHKCNNRDCVNPDHLKAVKHLENSRFMSDHYIEKSKEKITPKFNFGVIHKELSYK